MRVCLFTDTLGDINGVSRFIRDAAECALGSGRDLRVFTSTRFEVPPGANLYNFPPPLAGRIPRYENLEIVLPPARAMLRAAAAMKPDVIHISTPGPVGLVGALAARRLKIPVLGVYHTDFPAYIGRLFESPPLTGATTRYMRRFYRGFHAVFSRSADYAASIERLGVAAERITRLRPGINTDTFSPRHRDPGIWERHGVPAGGVKALYCGRISIEKNLPLLTRTWRTVSASFAPLTVAPAHRLTGSSPAQLIIIGDGPYRAQMQQELRDTPTHFFGFRHGEELSALYASADCFVFPSLTDTLGQVVMEAQSSGLPVLVSDKGGPKEVVKHGITGLVLPSERPRAWAEALLALINDGPRRQQMGRAAAESIRPMTIGASFEHWWEVHEAAVSRGLPTHEIRRANAREPAASVRARRGELPTPGQAR
jgi:glycosyltransferase involved in cell wall biosynthesis